VQPSKWKTRPEDVEIGLQYDPLSVTQLLTLNNKALISPSIRYVSLSLL
jgi:hypothetical protein